MIYSSKSPLLLELLSKNFILLAFSAIFFTLGYVIDGKNNLLSYPHSAKQFVKALHEKEAEAENNLFGLSEMSESGKFPATGQINYKRFSKKDIFFYVYAGDSLVFWTGNGVPLSNIKEDFDSQTKVLRLENGWYLRKSLVQKNLKYLALIKLKQEFQFQNEYLTNTFPTSYRLSSDVEIRLQKASKEDVPIYSKSGGLLFWLDFSAMKKGPADSITGILFYMLGVLLLGLVLVKWYAFLEKVLGKRKIPLILIPLLIALRVFSLVYPQDFNGYNLFDPSYYASSKIFPSFGDMLINVVLVLILVGLIIRLFPRKNSVFRSQLRPLIIGLFLFGLLFFYGSFITDLFKGIIDNSSINFHLSDLFRLDSLIYFGLLSISLLYLSFFALGNRIVLYLKFAGVDKNLLLVCLLGVTASYVIINHFYGWVDMIMVLWPVVICLVIFYHQYTKNGKYPYASVILTLSFFAFLSSHILSKYSKVKEEKSRVFLAERFVTDQDPITESLYPEIVARLSELEFDKSLLDNITNDTLALKERLINKIFTGYWVKYNIEIEVYDGNTKSDTFQNDEYKERFLELDKLLGHDSNDGFSNLVYVAKPDLGMSYLFRFNIYEKNSSKAVKHIFFILSLKEVPEEIGFPVLLLDTRSNSLRELKGYSYARYVNHSLVKSFGSYEYPLADFRFKELSKEDMFFVEGTHHHLYHKESEGNAIVLSTEKEDFFAPITLFSYLFSFHSIVLLFILLLRNINLGFKFSLLNLKVKVQILIASILLITLVLFAVGTRYFIEHEYKEKNFSLISEKIESVLVEMSNKIKDRASLRLQDKPYLDQILGKFSNVFFTDISLYDTNGDLLASSRNQLFDEGLLSRKMQPEAFVQLSANKRSKFIHEEQIGKMEYLSAYVPFVNNDGKLLAYLNLPYFARQDELENEIFTFLISIVNIFVLLFGFSMVSALFITNWITKPLKLLQDNLSRVEFGKSNTAIEYSGNDEIASLVNEYNKKVVELKKSSELLAKSERESAWREMAKQVAHEIKNPLTPMKLSVQHLQRSKGDRNSDWDDKFDRVSKMLIEQIDTLSEIAGEFSDFAKMPVAERKKIDVISVLSSVIELHKEEKEVHIELITKLEGEQFVYADKNQISRVFTNLIKNACQAIPAKNEGVVTVLLIKKESEFIVEVKDNGTGIPESEQKKIFSPNFTTKTNGMGLGLAMVKNIVEGSGGKVWFSSIENVGTSFFIVLPEFNA